MSHSQSTKMLTATPTTCARHESVDERGGERRERHEVERWRRAVQERRRHSREIVREQRERQLEQQQGWNRPRAHNVQQERRTVKLISKRRFRCKSAALSCIQYEAPSYGIQTRTGVLWSTCYVMLPWEVEKMPMYHLSKNQLSAVQSKKILCSDNGAWRVRPLSDHDGEERFWITMRNTQIEHRKVNSKYGTCRVHRMQGYQNPLPPQWEVG